MVSIPFRAEKPQPGGVGTLRAGRKYGFHPLLFNGCKTAALREPMVSGKPVEILKSKGIPAHKSRLRGRRHIGIWQDV